MIIHLNKGYNTIIDDEDYEKIEHISWSVDTYHINKMYVVGRLGNKKVRLHRFLMNLGIGDPRQVDHINGNKLDNRKCNLRICTSQQNTMNCKRYKNNTSGYKGVTWEKESNKWLAYIYFNKKQIKLGRFNNVIDAAISYNQAALKYFGEFAKLNEVLV